MTRRSSLLAALLLVAALAPAAARAGRVTFDPWPVGLRAAVMTWGGQPPCGTPTIVHDDTTDATPDGQPADAWVHQDPDDPKLTDCVIHITRSGDASTPGEKCAIVVHEVGHLFGLGHTSNPKDIMYGGDDDPSDGTESSEDARWHESWACTRLIRHTPYAQRCDPVPKGWSGCVWIYQWTLASQQQRLPSAVSSSVQR